MPKTSSCIRSGIQSMQGGVGSSDRDAAHSINIPQRPASAAPLALRGPRDLACLNPSLQQNHPSPSPTPQSLYGSTVSVVAPFKGATQCDRQRPLPHRDSHHMAYLNAPARLMHIGRLQACLDADRRLHHLRHRQHQDHRSSDKKCEPGNHLSWQHALCQVHQQKKEPKLLFSIIYKRG